MKVKFLCLLLIALVSCSTGESRSVRTVSVSSDSDVVVGNTEHSNEAARTLTSQITSGDDQTNELVQQLLSNNEGDRQRVKGKIILLARQAPEARARVIQALIQFVEVSDTELRLSSAAHYDAWSSAIELLGELKATEALGLLIECISCNNGTGGLSFYRYPALRAIVMFGPAAVPKLAVALNDSSPVKRKYAALALGEIGGAEAKMALEEALIKEQDSSVIPSIRIALRQHTQTNSP